MKKTFTAAEVATHNTEADCWVIVAGRVFDVTAYLPKHPGGKQLVSRSAGQDVTKDFEAMFHSIRARAKLEELYIGDLAGSSSQFLAPWSNSSKVGSRAASAAPGPGRGPYGLGAPGSGAAALLPTSGRPVKLSASSWTALTLTAAVDEGHECKLLTFALPNNGHLGLKPSQHVRVRLGNVVRSYTPVEWTKSGSFQLLVKSYPAPAGFMSRHLCSMKVGDEIEFNGPLGEFVWEKKRAESAVHRLVLVGMGTGVTPLVQLLRAVQDCDWSKGKTVSVLFLMAYRDEEHVLLPKSVRQLEALAGGLLRVRYFFSSNDERLTPEIIFDDLKNATQVCASGTDEFVKTFRDAVADDNKFHGF